MVPGVVPASPSKAALPMFPLTGHVFRNSESFSQESLLVHLPEWRRAWRFIINKTNGSLSCSCGRRCWLLLGLAASDDFAANEGICRSLFGPRVLLGHCRDM